jgi:beta-glucanase (GH16 family)
MKFPLYMVRTNAAEPDRVYETSKEVVGDDPYWEAGDLWYGVTNNQEWYDPSQVTTKGGKLSILLENVPERGLQYRCGILQSWNKFCFTSGYIEVSMTLLGPNTETTGYMSRFWFHAFFCVEVLCSCALLYFLVTWRVDYG